VRRNGDDLGRLVARPPFIDVEVRARHRRSAAQVLVAQHPAGQVFERTGGTNVACADLRGERGEAGVLRRERQGRGVDGNRQRKGRRSEDDARRRETTSRRDAIVRPSIDVGDAGAGRKIGVHETRQRAHSRQLERPRHVGHSL
jgi:hypothetical protein